MMLNGLRGICHKAYAQWETGKTIKKNMSNEPFLQVKQDENTSASVVWELDLNEHCDVLRTITSASQVVTPLSVKTQSRALRF